jgi:hypothetical protein
MASPFVGLVFQTMFLIVNSQLISYLCGIFILTDKIMAQVAGIKIERSSKGCPQYVRIDLRKHADIIPLLEKKGVEMDEPIKWTAKMKRSFEQAKNGELFARSLEDLLNV